MDLRQLMGAVLTISMFAMIGNMIRRDHFAGDILLDVPANANVQPEVAKVSRQSLIQLSSVSKVLSKEHGGQLLKPCWNKTLPQGKEHSKGYVSFSLTDGPEYHILQVANAALVAKQLGATLVLPEIIGSKGDKRPFGEVYDDERFVKSMSSMMEVLKAKPAEVSARKLVTVRVPFRVAENYISAKIEPLFQKTGNLRLTTYFPSSSMKQGKVDNHLNPVSCLAIFEALQLQPKLQEVVDSIIARLRSRKPNGVFTAVDFRSEMLGKGVCRASGLKGVKSCYNAVEIRQFLQKVGFPKDTTIYVTQSRRDSSLGALKDLYPNTLTKDIMEEDEKRKFLNIESSVFRDAIDFHICSVSDVFVPGMSGLFYFTVAGNRIASGNARILVPAQLASTSATDHLSSFISKKNHPAYSCFCDSKRRKL